MSSVQELSKNQTIRVYYKAPEQVDNLDVRFDFFTVGGSYLVNSQTSDGFVTGKGIYYYDFTAPNQDTYVLGRAYKDGFVDVEPIVFKIGEPEQHLLFYYTEKTIVGSLEYRIYTTDGTSIQSGVLNPVSDTFFWYTEFLTPSEASSDGNYFFEVDDTYSVQPFTSGVVAFTPSILQIISSIIEPQVSGQSLYSQNSLTANLSIINPEIHGDALIQINVFEALATSQDYNDVSNNVSIQSVSSNIINPVIKGDANITVSVFDAITSIPEVAQTKLQTITSNLIQPQIKADAVVNVSSIYFNSLVNNPIVLETLQVNSLNISSELLQPVVKAEIVKDQGKQPSSGYPYDNKYTLGAGAGIPIGVVSGNRTRYITVQFKICKNNFTCEEGIYQKESGLLTSTKIDVKNIRHSYKKTKISMRGEVSRHANDKDVKLKVTNLEKV